MKKLPKHHTFTSGTCYILYKRITNKELDGFCKEFRKIAKPIINQYEYKERFVLELGVLLMLKGDFQWFALQYNFNDIVKIFDYTYKAKDYREEIEQLYKSREILIEAIKITVFKNS